MEEEIKEEIIRIIWEFQCSPLLDRNLFHLKFCQCCLNLYFRTPYDLAEYIERGLNTGRSNHRTPQNFRRYPEHECDYYAGPCATSF